MPTLRPLRLLVLGLALFASAICAQSKSPNFVFILADDQGWTGTSLQMDSRVAGSRSDYYETPNLERLAKQGMRFSQAYAPHPNCSPTRMSIQTGKSPARLGAYDIIDIRPGAGFGFYETQYVNKPLTLHLPIHDLPAEDVTIAELLKRERPGYVTGHFGKWHMDGGDPSEHGYDQSDGTTKNGEGREGPPNPKKTSSVTKRAVEFLREQAASKKPFYMQVSYYAVHTPVLAMPHTIDAYESKEKGQHHTAAAYGAMTQELDEGLGAILDAMDELGLAENTYFVYFSDNGGEVTGEGVTNNHPLAKGKTHCAEGGIRVPMVVRGPGVQASSQSSVPVIGWDFLPTFADILGIESLPADIDGGSIRSLLENGGKGEVRRPREELVWYYPAYRDMKGVKPQGAVRKGNYKLIQFYEDGAVELFDLAKDVGETNNLADKMPELAKEMAAGLDAYLSLVEAKRPTKNLNYDPSKPVQRPRGRRRPGAAANN